MHGQVELKSFPSQSTKKLATKTVTPPTTKFKAPTSKRILFKKYVKDLNVLHQELGHSSKSTTIVIAKVWLSM